MDAGRIATNADGDVRIADFATADGSVPPVADTADYQNMNRIKGDNSQRVIALDTLGTNVAASLFALLSVVSFIYNMNGTDSAASGFAVSFFIMVLLLTPAVALQQSAIGLKNGYRWPVWVCLGLGGPCWVYMLLVLLIGGVAITTEVFGTAPRDPDFVQGLGIFAVAIIVFFVMTSWLRWVMLAEIHLRHVHSTDLARGFEPIVDAQDDSASPQH